MTMDNDTITTQESASNVVAAINDQAVPGILNSRNLNHHDRNGDSLADPTVALPLQVEPAISDATQVSYADHSYISDVSLKPLSWVIDEIRSSAELKKKIETVRSEADPKKRKALKAALLPYFTFSHFSENKRDKVHFKSTKFILIDIDHVADRLKDLVEKFRTDSRIFLFFVSPSGDGLKVVFALRDFITDNPTYERVYKHFQGLMKEWYAVEPDTSTIDSSHCCFLSSDADLHVNWNADLLDLPAIELNVIQLPAKEKGDSDLLILMGGVAESGRHLATTRLASFYKNKGMDYLATLATMKSWNQMNKPPLDEAELEKTIYNVFKRDNYGTRDRVLPKERKMWTGEELGDFAENHPLVELVEGVFSDEAVYMLAGQDKSGKSILAMNLALSVAGTKDHFLSWKIMKHGPVVYFNNELSERQMGRRIVSMCGRSVCDVHYMNDKDLRFDDNIDEILDFCRKYKPVLVIVDCHYRTSTADKDVGSKIQKVLENYTRIKEEMKCCVVVIHHTRKSAVGQRADSSQAMGSHTFAMMTDGNFQLKRSDTEPEKRILFETGSRDFSGFSPRLIALNPMGFLWFRDLGECNEEEHTMEIGKMRKKQTEQYAVKVLEDRKGALLKMDLLDAIMDAYGISKASAYRSIDKASKSGKIAESAQHVVTLVKAPDRVVVPESDSVEESVPELVLEG